MAAFPFTDLHSFKDYVTFVRMCAPSDFPKRQGVPVESQWSLDFAFKGLHEGLSYLPQDSTSTCRELFNEAHQLYAAGDRKGGFQKLEEARKFLMKLPSK